MQWLKGGQNFRPVLELPMAQNFRHRGRTSNQVELKRNSKTEAKLPVLYESKVKLRG
jgi:hypothetical protein